MPFPTPTQDHIDFFNKHGWIVIKNAIPQADLDLLEGKCNRIIDEKERLAFDWAWSEDESKEERTFKIVQGSPTLVWPEIAEQQYRQWIVDFAGGLMGMKLSFWYDQFLAKPPGKSVPTYWHQDEGYWGRNLFDKGITGWIPLQDVTAQNGCMHVIDGGHKLGVIPHHLVEGVQSDLLTCPVDEKDMVVCPISRGDVTFHHSKMPHMTTANLSKRWRKAVSNHMQAVGAGGEGGHFPWKIYVNQRTGEVLTPVTS